MYVEFHFFGNLEFRTTFHPKFQLGLKTSSGVPKECAKMSFKEAPQTNLMPALVPLPI